MSTDNSFLDAKPTEVSPELRAIAERASFLSLIARRKTNKKIGRNSPCPCGSGKKFKKCHLRS